MRQLQKRNKVNNRRKTEKLWNKNPHCHWCGKKTILSDALDGVITNPRTATFDHLYGRANPMRNDWNKELGVLSCYECNHERGKWEFKVLRISSRAERCTTAHKYKGLKPPKCNNGHPCRACLYKYNLMQLEGTWAVHSK